MTQFSDLQRDLESARRTAFELSRQLFQQRQHLNRCLREKGHLERFTPKNTSSRSSRKQTSQRTSLDRKIAGLTTRVERLRDELSAAQKLEQQYLTDFLALSDPRSSITNLSDEIPILLLPLRIETRFKQASETGHPSDEMWVRVYPDDIAVDTFEDTLSETEIVRARAYWVNMWRAGGVEAEERGAWKSLVSSHSSGRSHWIVENYRPTNEDAQPIKDRDNPSVILVISVQSDWEDVNRESLFEFWERMWRAEGNLADQQDALRQLIEQVGEERAQQLQEQYVPKNIGEEPPYGLDRADVRVQVVTIEFPSEDAVVARESSWSQAARVDVMPERLVLLGYSDGGLVLEELGNPIPSPLVVGPDPSAEDGNFLQLDDDDNLQVNEEMRWVVDFERAIEVGMGFKIPLDPLQFRKGFDTLVVLGVRLRSDASVAQKGLEELIDHHHHSRTEFAIVPQGRPTNNVEGTGSGYSWREDADASFDRYFAAGDRADPDDWFEKTDGRWLAECLGLDPAAIASIPNYYHRDICQARAMNVALWPATLGYFMESMLHPVFAPETVQQTRSFFNQHVSARGTIPAIRVGQQPYGILPATPRSRMSWLQQVGQPSSPSELPDEVRFLLRLYSLLRQVEADWSVLQDRVSFVGKLGEDSQQILLDVVGLHAGSVEHYQRYAESFLHLFNSMRVQGAGGAFWAMLQASTYIQTGLNLLGDLGYSPPVGAETPDMLEKFFLRKPNLLKGGLVDDRPLSETDRIRAYTESGDDYISWAIKAARTSHNVLRQQEGFIDNKPPTALLYLMLHHALDLSFVETSLQLFLGAGLLTADQVNESRREVTFNHISGPSSSRWQYLYRNEPAIGGGQTIGDFIPTVLSGMTATAYLDRQLHALEHLKGASSAALERAFAEHLDLCTYRLDAWFGGLMSRQLTHMRNTDGAEGDKAKQGIYLGAYGWLENIRPEFKKLTPVTLEPELAEVFKPSDDPPLMRDSTNAGYIHAPSLNHAVTAAVLRNGYLSNATPEAPNSLAINLSSERVRLALQIIEGMRAGQNLAALLGYQFERGLHDRHDVEVDAFIYDLRNAFPLSAKRFASTRPDRQDEFGRRIGIRRIAARNVIDGLSLVEHIKSTGNRNYPFGLDEDVLPPLDSADQGEAIDAEAERLANIADAVADLAMAESVHQVVQGNYARAGATLDTYSKGKFPTIPDVIKTPRSGITLNHRVGLHLEAGLDPSDPANSSPRAKAEPAINKWLGQQLPPAEVVACTVIVTDRRADSEVTHIVTQADLGLTPIDLLYLVDTDSRKAMKALDDAIEHHVIVTHTPKPHAEIAIAYRDTIASIDGHVSFFELATAIRSLRALLLRSRPLRPTDMALATEARDRDDVDVSFNLDRVTLIRDELASHLGELTTFQTTLQAFIDNEQFTDLVVDIDSSIAGFSDLVQVLSPFDRPEVGIGSVIDDRRRITNSLLDKLVAIVERWDGKLAEFDGAIANYDLLPDDVSEAQKFLDLQKAERLISTQYTIPLPATADELRDALVTVKRVEFLNQRESLQSLLDNASTVGDLYTELEDSTATRAEFDAIETSFEDDYRQILAIADDLSSRAASLVFAVQSQLASANAKILEWEAATQPQAQLEAAIATAKILLGEEFQILPEFGLTANQAVEWGNAWGTDDSADRSILDYLTGERMRRYPIDDWLAGISRVREKMHHLENVICLADALADHPISLQPLQFPYHESDLWLGLEFPQQRGDDDPFEIDEDKLLYTAHYATPFNPTGRQCGLLLDEWTEVIPSQKENTGLTFHYDRPNSEPPQVLLLAMPSLFDGSWQWNDLLDTVHETMDLAKKRAIEPDHIDSTAYSKLLPAIVSAVTLYPITASVNFAFNNDLAENLASQPTDSDGN